MMADTKRKVPNLRFKGFTNDWEQRKLVELVVPRKSYSLTRKVETKNNTGFKYIHYGDIHTEKAKIINDPQQLPSIVKGDYLSLSNGDIVVADASEDYKGIADAAILLNKGKYSIVAGLHTIAFHPQESVIFPLFLYYQLNTERFSHYGYRVGTGLKVFGISSNLFFDYLCCYPKINEQIKISKMIAMFSKLISLQQRKLALLKQLKNGLLQKMFADKDEKQPVLRFNSFSDNWEQHKLGNIAKIIAGGDKNNSLINSRGGYPVIANSVNTDGIVGYYSKKFRIKAPAITVTGRGDIGKATPRFVNFTPVVRLLALTTPHNVVFIANAINRIRIFNESTGVPQLTAPQLSKYKIGITNYQEESFIGNLISTFENVLALQQSRLGELTLIKKFLLQQMFI